MENIEIYILVMLSGLLILHCAFALRAFHHGVNLSIHKLPPHKPSTQKFSSHSLGTQKLSSQQTCLWCLLSLLFGPLGYYSYLGLLPLDTSLKE